MLAPGGRLVAPIGAPHDAQWLQLWREGVDGHVSHARTLAVRFVPRGGATR